MAKIDGFPIFVPGLYPGDRARVEITEVRRGFARGTRREILARTPLRRSISCPVAETCGGCDWAELRLDAQLDAKRRILVESLRRTGRFDPDSLPEIRIHPSPLDYRLRSRLHAGPAEEGGPSSLGFFAKACHEVVPLPAECEVVGPGLLKATGSIRSSGLADGDEIIAFETPDDIVIQASSSGAKEVSLRVDATIPPGESTSFRYVLSTDSFFQVNRHLLGTLVGIVGAAAAPVRDRSLALDLFAGVGFFTLPLARMFERVVSVEDSRESYRYALVNAGSEPGVRPLRGRVEEVLRDLDDRASFILLDPPRAGAHAEVISEIDRLSSSTIAWLSCDPVTLARDLRRLADRGWALASLDLIDLFPNTHHVETFAVMTR